MLKLIVKHICGHYELHIVDAKDDKEAAIIECQLQKCLCSDCQEEG